jgi:hypothetical protein
MPVTRPPPYLSEHTSEVIVFGFESPIGTDSLLRRCCPSLGTPQRRSRACVKIKLSEMAKALGWVERFRRKSLASHAGSDVF